MADNSDPKRVSKDDLVELERKIELINEAQEKAQEKAEKERIFSAVERIASAFDRIAAVAEKQGQFIDDAKPFFELAKAKLVGKGSN